MASGNEYLTSNAYVAYPFKEDAEAITYEVAPVHGAIATVPPELFVDALFRLSEDLTGLLYLKSIAESGTVYTFSFKDEDDNNVLVDSVDIAGWDVALRYQVITLSDGDYLAKIVVPTAAFLAFVLGITGTDVFDSRLPMGAGTLSPDVPRVLSLRLYNEGLSGPTTPVGDFEITERIRLASGYNIQQLISESTDLDTTEIEIVATPGTGLGIVPCTDPGHTEVHEPLMDVTPDDQGNIIINPGAEKCYTVVPHPAIQTYEIQGACEQCCTCDDYADVVRALGLLFDRAKAAYDALEDAKTNATSGYDIGVSSFNDTIAPDYMGPKLQANGMGGVEYNDDLKIRFGASRWATLTISIENRTADDCTLNMLEITVNSPLDYDVVHISWEYNSEGDGPLDIAAGIVDIAGVPTIERGKTLSFYVLLYSDGADEDPDWDIQVDADVTPLGEAAVHLADIATFT